jgi:Carboxypeptidase regulatory-like domain/TonB dependent receptor
MMRSLRSSLIVCLLAMSGFAQSNQGTITGTISDPAGAVVPGAAIEVKNTDTGVVFRGGTSNTGNYVIRVPAGTYSVTVSVPGFKQFVEQNIQVIVATDTRTDIKLEVGQTNEVVTVQDTEPILKTESGEMSHTVTTDDADVLPVLTISGGGVFGATPLGNIRNPLAVASLIPGVTFANDNSMVVNGLPSNSETIRTEGQDSTGTIWKVAQQASQGSVDAIQEVSIQTSNFSAEYGQVGGGYFNYTMKSGTNQFHGSGYDYFVNEALNAGLPFTDAGTISPDKEGQHIRNPVRQNDYGFTIGGPIRIPKVYNGTNRTFFFFNFEQFRQSLTTENSLTTVPTAAYRQGNFGTAGCFAYVAAANTCAFSPPIANGAAPATDSAGQALSYGEIFDPGTTREVNGYQVRSPFPNNTIPLSRFDPVALALQNMLPLPNQPGIENNYLIPAYVNWQHTTNFSWKLDHSISPTAKLSWYFSRLLTNSPGNNGFASTYGGSTPTAERNTTTRVNFDDTLRPTLLLHIGVGYFQDYDPTIPAKFNEASIGLNGYYDENLFPTITGLTNYISGGWGANLGGLGAGFGALLWEEKPTGNASLTWVHGNHIFKYGGEFTVDGYPEHSTWRANGSFAFAAAETADPWQNGQPLNIPNPTGFSYASFLLGQPDTLQLSPLTQTKLGNHFFGLYAQDSWKVTRKFTLDYGLRYDFQTYLQEEHGRMQDASLSTPNPTVGGLLGAGVYEGYGGGRCNCELSHNYPFAFGPRLGAAYQITPKTVLRAGAGITYGLVQTPAGASYSTADYYSFNAPGYGISPMPTGLSGPNPYPNLTWPNFSTGKYPVETNGQLPPGNPFLFFDPSARPPRILQWSIGIQRELQKDIVVEATYVGNRGVWWAAPYMDQMTANGLTPAILAAHGLNIANPSTQSLLTSQLDSPQAIAAGFGNPPYAGFPLTDTVAQALRPIPQWLQPDPWLGPPIGKTWYDALQTKVTKRFSYGLSMQASYVFSKATDLGTGAETGYYVAGTPLVSDIYNYGINKQLNQLSRPDVFLVSGTYVTPKLKADGTGLKVLSVLTRDWTVGFLLRYQNGALIQTPPSTNQLTTQLERSIPDFFSVDTNFDNRVPGVNPLAVNPNCGCFNPQTTSALNPNAWATPPGGAWGSAAPFYNNYRWQRQPAESASFGRNFRFGREGRFNLNVRAEFQNIFNRLFLQPPGVGTAAGVTTSILSPLASTGGVNTGGYGYIPTLNGTNYQPRSGKIVARFTF